MNLPTDTVKKSLQTSADFSYSDGSNATDIVMASASYMNQSEGKNVFIGQKQRDVQVMQSSFYFASGNANPDKHSDSGEILSIGSDRTMNECLDRGRGINLFENDAMEELFDDCEDREIVVDNAMEIVVDDAMEIVVDNVMNVEPGIEEMGSYSEANKAGTSQSSECVNDKINVAQVCINESSKKKTFRCSYCCKMFSSKGNLKTHQFESCGEDECRRVGRSRNCPECDKVFSSKGTLNAHMYEIHNNKKYWYQCSFCEESFTYLYALRIHRAMHGKHKPYPCSMCDKRFMSTTTQKFHFKKKHTT